MKDVVIKYHRLIITIITIVILYFLYAAYRFEIFLWFCENEANGPACTQVALFSMEKNDTQMAKYYFNESCKLQYGLGCFHLGHLLNDKSLIEKACKYQLNMACEELK